MYNSATYVCLESYYALKLEIGSIQSIGWISMLLLQDGEYILAPNMHLPAILCGILVVQCVLVRKRRACN